MEIEVTLENFEPADNSLTRSGVYTFKPTGANCTIPLRTTDGAKTCKVSLQEPCFESNSKSIEQANKISTTINELNVTFKWTWKNAPNENNVTPSLSITDGTINMNGTITRSRTGDNKNYTYNITMKNIVISNADMNSNVTIKYTSGNRTFTKTINVQELINNPNITLSSQ